LEEVQRVHSIENPRVRIPAASEENETCGWGRLRYKKAAASEKASQPTTAMARVLVLIAAIALVGVSASSAAKEATAVQVLRHVYQECVQFGSLSCVKPKLLAFISTAVKHDQIPVTKVSNAKNWFLNSYQFTFSNYDFFALFGCPFVKICFDPN